MLKRFIPLVFFCSAVPAMSAPEAAQPLVALQQMDGRVASIGYRLARANLDICSRKMPLSGMLVHALDQYSKSARPAAAEAFGLGDEPAVLIVVPDSPAARAGLKAGDKLLSIAGKSFDPVLRKKGNYQRIQEIEQHLIAGLSAGPVRIAYLRDGAGHNAVIEPESGCVSRVQLIPSRRLNASADGTYVQVTSAIVEFTRDDDELALVIAHEMAHNILGHRMELDRQNVSRGLLKSFDGSAGKIKVTEIEADYLALYLLANAGFDIGKATGFWDRYGRKMGLGILSDGTHPGRSSRMEAALRTIEEIQSKRGQSGPLKPGIAT